MEDILKLIKLRLLEIDMMQQDLAEKIGRSVSFVSRVCAGRYVPPIEDRRAIAKVLKCSMVKLWPSLKP